MTTAKLVRQIKDYEAFDIDHALVDRACWERLQVMSSDFGSNGDAARQLLDVVAQLLEFDDASL